jgi:4-amino-4-deoxy-L-arabinose transferase-like glycosyltransferase
VKLDWMSGLKPGRKSLTLLLVVAAVLLRVVALKSDAYPALSWSSALLTDEGFYIHNARNVVLFGAARQDGFNNMLIMPVLHCIQVLVFKLFGVGIVQARAIPVALSLIGLGFFFAAIRSLYGFRCAFAAALFLGLDHTRFLYDRLALMDAPAASILCIAVWAVVTGFKTRGSQSDRLFCLAGVLCFAAYGVRGLTAPLLALPAILLFTGPAPSEEKRAARRRVFACLSGAAAAGVAYVVALYLPNRSEMRLANRFYARQLLPATLADVERNIHVTLFGEGRGLVPFFLHHSPVVFLLALCWLGLAQSSARRVRTAEATSEQARQHIAADRALTLFSGWWLLSIGSILMLANYSPSRYYVLISPPLALFAARMSTHASHLPRAFLNKPAATAIIGGLVTYHAAVAVLDRVHPLALSHFTQAYRVAEISALLLFIAGLWLKAYRKLPALIAHKLGLVHPRRMQIAALILWLLVNAGWCIDWASHWTYRQQAADDAIARTTEKDAVIFGALAPGLCINNGRRTVLMIDGLSNYVHPLSLAKGKPSYLAILDDNGWREEWWYKHYPGEIYPVNRILTFKHMLRPNFTIAVYKLGDRPVWRQN